MGFYLPKGSLEFKGKKYILIFEFVMGVYSNRKITANLYRYGDRFNANYQYVAKLESLKQKSNCVITQFSFLFSKKNYSLRLFYSFSQQVQRPFLLSKINPIFATYFEFNMNTNRVETPRW